MPSRNLIQGLSLIALPIIALIGGLNEKLWLVALVVICHTTWVLCLLVELKNKKYKLEKMEETYRFVCKELEMSRTNPQRRLVGQFKKNVR